MTNSRFMTLQDNNGVSSKGIALNDGSANGFIVTGNAYRHFLTRNGMNGLVEELITTLPPDKAAEIISKRFEQSRYNSEEISILRANFQQLKKPVNLYAHVVCSVTGEPVASLETMTKQDVKSFDVFSDGIVQIWQSCWRKENLERLHYQLEQASSKEQICPNFEVVLRIEEAPERPVAMPENQELPQRVTSVPIITNLRRLLTKK